MNNRIKVKTIISLFLSVILVAGVIVMSPPFAAYGEAYQSFKCEGNNVNIDNLEKVQQRQTENNNNFDAAANIQQQLTSTGAEEEEEEEEPLNVLTSNSNGNGNGERLLTLKNVCLNFGNNENSGLITPPIDTTETLTVIKNVDCQADIETCEQNPINPSDFTILVEGNNPSQNYFLGSSTGTDIQLEAGQYSVTEQGLDPVIPEICNTMGFDAGREASDLGENLFICTSFSAKCAGNIAIGNPQICYIKNVIVQQNVVGNNVYVTWWAWGDTTPTDVFFTSSNDNGKTFSTPIIVSNNNFGGFLPKIIAVGSNVYITYTATVSDRYDVFFTSSNDNGKTFSNPINLSNDPANDDEPQISAVGNNVYVTWTYTTSSTIGFFFTSSNDNGKTFSNPVNLGNDVQNSYAPQISAVGNNVYITYFSDMATGNQDVFFTSSNDNGKTFSNPVNLSNNSRISTNPQISSHENNVYVVWYDFTPCNFEIFFTVSNDNGQTFSATKNLSNNPGQSGAPQIAIVENNVYVTWADETPDNYDIFFTSSNDNGKTFSNPINLSNTPGYVQSVQIIAVKNNIYITWMEYTSDNFDVLFTLSNDNGQTFKSPSNLSNNTGDSGYSQISAVRNNVYVTWFDNTEGFFKILFTVSNDNGQTFNMPLNLTNAVGSQNPQIAVASLELEN